MKVFVWQTVETKSSKAKEKKSFADLNRDILSEFTELVSQSEMRCHCSSYPWLITALPLGTWDSYTKQERNKIFFLFVESTSY